jgi:hypothetical protein
MDADVLWIAIPAIGFVFGLGFIVFDCMAARRRRRLFSIQLTSDTPKSFMTRGFDGSRPHADTTLRELLAQLKASAWDKPPP